MRTLRHFLENLLFLLISTVLRLMPRRWVLGLGDRLGRFAFRHWHSRRRIALDNCTQALQVDEERATTIVRDSFRHFGRVLCDTLHLFARDESALFKCIDFEGLEHLQAAAQRGRGVLVFSGHYGHWELVALVQGYLGHPLAMITRRLDNPWLERRLVALRSRSGNLVIHKIDAARRTLRQLQSGGGVAILIDQDQGDRGVYVPFLGRLASTTPTLASLARHTGAAIVPVRSSLREDGRYEIVYEAPIEIEGLDTQQLTARCSDRLAAWIRQQPEMWLWMHRRWKSKPRER